MKKQLLNTKGIRNSVLLVILLTCAGLISAQQTQHAVVPFNNANAVQGTMSTPVRAANVSRHTHEAVPASSTCDTDLILDYAAWDEVYARTNGLNYNASWYTEDTALQLQAFSNFKTLASEDSGYYNYAGVVFDTLVFANPYDSLYSTLPLTGTTVYFDSLTVVEALTGDSTKMANDSLLFLIYSYTNGTFSTNPVKTLVYHAWSQLKQFYAAGNSVNIVNLPVHYQFTSGQGLAVLMEYHNKNKTSLFNLAYSYPDSCGTVVYGGNTYISPAYPPILPGNEFYGVDSINAVSNFDNTAGYFADGFATNCSYVYTQNWALIPMVTVCYAAAPPAVTITPTEVLCHGQSTGSAAAVATGGTGTFTYAWSNSATTATIGNIAAGTYTVTVTSGGQTATASVTITQPATALAVSPSATQTSCTGNTGTVTANASGGTGAYTYAWSNAANNAIITALPAATYTVTVTDANACTASGTATVTTPPAFSVSITPTNVKCFGSNTGVAVATVTGSAGTLTYNWSDGSTTATISNKAAGTYVVTVTETGACTSTATTTITQPASGITVSASATQTSCGANNGTATVTASGGTGSLTYGWSNSATTTTINNLGVGNYNVTVTDGNSCTATASAIVNTSATFTVNVTSTNVSCYGQTTGSASATVSGANGTVVYLWSNGATTQNLTSLAAGTYNVTVTDASACPKTNSTTVTQPASALTASVATTPTACSSSTGTATATVSGGTPNYTFAWSNSTSANPASSLAGGNISLTVTDANSCSVTTSATVSLPAADNLTLTPTPATCNGESTGSVAASVIGNGNYTYAWSNGGSTATISNVAAIAYTVTVTDGLGCTVSGTSTVSQPAAIVVTTTTTDATNGANGTATASATGGTGAFTYAWSGSVTTATASNLAAGTYTVTVTDANSCTATASATIVATGISNITSNITNITLIPNPATDMVKVVVSLTSAQSVEFRLVDITGKYIYTAHESTVQGNVTHTINLSQFSAGIYLVEIAAGNDVTRQRLVIAK